MSNMSRKKTGIYKLTLIKDGRIYIGSSVNIKKRWEGHKSASTIEDDSIQYIQKALRKYGINAFSWEIMELCSEELLIEREQHYLDILQPFPRLNQGFNIREIADSNLGIKFSDEAKQKLKGRIPWNKGKIGQQIHSNDTKKEMSNQRQGENNSFFGSIHSDKTKKQISKTRKEKIKSGEITPTAHSDKHKKWLSEQYIGENNFNAKEYIITEPTGRQYKIKSLSTWCSEQKFSRHTANGIIKNQKTPNRGPMKDWLITHCVD